MALTSAQMKLYDLASPEDKLLADYMGEIYRRTYGAAATYRRKYPGGVFDIEAQLDIEAKKYPFTPGMTVERTEQPEVADEILGLKLDKAMEKISESDIQAIIDDMTSKSASLPTSSSSSANEVELLGAMLSKSTIKKNQQPRVSQADINSASAGGATLAQVAGRAGRKPRAAPVRKWTQDDEFDSCTRLT
jgi:hypothetical protein